MAERRMFAKTIIDSDAFLDMPPTSQLLYFHLSMRADDDGFINKPKAVMHMVGAKEDDLKLLIVKKFIIPFENGIVVIKHWKIHNFIAKDRYLETKYKTEKSLLSLDENKAYTQNVNAVSTECIQVVNTPETQVRLGKDRLGKVRIEDERGASKPRFSPPSVEEVKAYCEERKNGIDAEAFVAFYESKGWKVGNTPMKSWKSAIITWEKKRGVQTGKAGLDSADQTSEGAWHGYKLDY